MTFSKSMIRHEKIIHARKPYASIAIPFVAVSIILAAGSTALAGGGRGDNGNDGILPAGSHRYDMGGSGGELNKDSQESDQFIFDPCALEAVECEGESGIKNSEKQNEIRGDRLVAGYDITRYATLPTHEATIAKIYASIPEIKDSLDADRWVHERAPSSPITGGMVVRASTEYNVDAKLLLALMANDSQLGTAGLGARTFNPGNIANRDDGHTFTYPSWEDGVRGVARWLAKHKTE